MTSLLTSGPRFSGTDHESDGLSRVAVQRSWPQVEEVPKRPRSTPEVVKMATFEINHLRGEKIC